MSRRAARVFSTPRLAALALAVSVLVAQLPLLPATLDDIDSVNFALGVRHFDVARHQPHPPGYPVFIALGKLSMAFADRLPALPAEGPVVPEARALAFWGALFAALAVAALFQLFRAIELNDRRALAATALTITCPLFWFTASRPLSDVPGLAAAAVAQALLATAFYRQRASAPADLLASGRLIVLGSLVAALAIGLRSQTFLLTLPLLAVVLLDRVGRDAAGALLGSTVALSVGVLAWAVPLVATSGGPQAYLSALSSQAGEDFAGVEMLATHPTARVLTSALVHTFVRPWAQPVLAAIVITFAAIGTPVMLARERRGLLVLAVIAVPYGLFHLAFHEAVTIRYALPLVPALAYLAVRGLDALARRAMPVVVATFAATALAIATPPLVTLATHPSPTFQALGDVRARMARGVRAEPVLAMHLPFALALRGERLPARALAAPPWREWLEVVDYWRAGGRAPVWFFADPRRTDLALIDHASRRLVRSYSWSFDQAPFMLGTRPGGLEWYEIRPPGWYLAEGWALTPEVAGVSDRFGRGPGRGPIVGYVRRRAEAAVLMIGGRHLGSAGDPDVRIEVTLDDRVLDSWTVSGHPGFFLRMWTLPEGTLAGTDAYARLHIVARAAAGGSRPDIAAIEQFDLQPATSVVYGFDAGWHEMEYSPATNRLWRWTSGAATLRVHHAGRDLRVRIVGESPLRYFDSAPGVLVRAGSEVLARVQPDSDFDWTINVPAAALDRSDGQLTLETDRVFVPAERSASADRRRLGLRVFSVKVDAADGPPR